jgi:hypothetical protein
MVAIPVEEPTARHGCHTGVIDQVLHKIYLHCVLIRHWLECLFDMTIRMQADPQTYIDTSWLSTNAQ